MRPVDPIHGWPRRRTGPVQRPDTRSMAEMYIGGADRSQKILFGAGRMVRDVETVVPADPVQQLGIDVRRDENGDLRHRAHSSVSRAGAGFAAAVWTLPALARYSPDDGVERTRNERGAIAPRRP